MNFPWEKCVSLSARNPMTTFNNLFSKEKSHGIGLRVLSHVLLTVFLELDMSWVPSVFFLGWSFCFYLASSDKMPFVRLVLFTHAFYKEHIAHFNNPRLSCYMSYCLNALDHTHLPHNRNPQGGKTKPKSRPPSPVFILFCILDGWQMHAATTWLDLLEHCSRGVPSWRTLALALGTLTASS